MRLIGLYEIGWCVAPDDAEAVAVAIRRALEHGDDAALRERLAAAAAELNWEREKDRLIGLYAKLDRSAVARPDY
jgi:glycosyltransferase involved in cell wall biosynthesis